MLEEILKPLAELSKPITKLIETVNSGIWTLYEPTYIRKNAKAKADEMKIIAKAKADSLVIENEVLRWYYLRTEEQKLLVEYRKKENRDSIILQAAQELKDKTVDDTKVDIDWVNQFFAYAENVSNEEMQSIWAKVLAGEVQKPNSFSKWALFTISIMSVDIAKSLLTVGAYSFQNTNGDIILCGWMGDYLKDNLGDYSLRASTGVLHALDLMHIYNFPKNLTFANTGTREIPFYMKDNKFKIVLASNLKADFTVGGQMFTKLGRELFPLLGGTGDKEDFINKYFEMARKNLKSRGIDCSLELG